jgi:CRISPR-associated protein Cmr5
VSQSLDQRRAKFALDRVKAVLKKDAEAEAHNLTIVQNDGQIKRPLCSSEYRSYARSMPFSILSNGLGQTLAIQLARSAGDNRAALTSGLLLTHVTGWLVSANGWGAASPYKFAGKITSARCKSDELIEMIVQGETTEYVRAQAEAIAFLKWLKKFAEALIVEEDNPPAADVDGGR